MAEGVYKIVEVVGVSENSWEEAGRNAVETAAGSLRDLRVAEVTKIDMTVKDGKVAAFRTRARSPSSTKPDCSLPASRGRPCQRSAARQDGGSRRGRLRTRDRRQRTPSARRPDAGRTVTGSLEDHGMRSTRSRRTAPPPAGGSLRSGPPRSPEPGDPRTGISPRMLASLPSTHLKSEPPCLRNPGDSRGSESAVVSVPGAMPMLAIGPER